jgi:hypothetical protein
MAHALRICRWVLQSLLWTCLLRQMQHCKRQALLPQQ